MTVIKGTGYYHVGASNTNRQVTFSFEADSGAGADLFAFLKGNNAFPPWIGANTSPATNDYIAQYRVDYLVRYVSIYAIPVAVTISDGAHAANTINITYETAVSNVLPSTADITDAYGLADRPAKMKSGLNTLAAACIANASLDGVPGDLFAADAPLADGTASTAPAITSFTVTLLTPSMY